MPRSVFAPPSNEQQESSDVSNANSRAPLWYVASLAACVVIRATDRPEAERIGRAQLAELIGSPVFEIRMVRRALPDEIALHYLGE